MDARRLHAAIFAASCERPAAQSECATAPSTSGGDVGGWVLETQAGLEQDVRPLGENHRAVNQQPGQMGEPWLARPKRGYKEDSPAPVW